jgi:hypothetical protein
MAFFVTGAIIGGVAGIGSALIGSNAASKAADTQAAAANNALAFQKQTYADSQPRFAAANTAFGNAQGSANANFQPYMDVGKNATYTLGQLTGANGNAPDYSSFYKDPSYGFAQSQGELGIERGANARGMNLSGGTLKDLSTFNSGVATQQYGNYFNRLMGLSQMGQNAAGGLTSATTNIAGGLGNLATGQASSNNAAATGIGNTMQGVGQAQASGIVGGANAITGGINSAANNALLAGYLGKNASGYGDPSYGGGSAWSGDSYGGSSSNPLAGLSASDYGKGY